MKFSESLVRKLIPGTQDLRHPNVRGRVGLLEGWTSVFGNLILFAIKLFFGLAASSIALIADAFHTLSDVATSGVVIFGFKVAQKPPDREHPFGHGRAETIATLTIAILMAVVAFEFMKGAIDRLFFSETIVNVESIDLLFLTVVTLTALGKAWMAWFAYQLGDLIDSDALRGDAVHHKSDVYTTVLVIAALIGVYLGFPLLDGIMGIAVALMILWSAYELARDAIDELLGKPASPELLGRIAGIATSIPGARQVHDVVVHNYGDQRFISLHVEIDEETKPAIAHNIADSVERKVSKKLYAEVVTHIDPVSVRGELVESVLATLESALADFELNTTVQDLRVVGIKEIESILFEIPVPADYPKEAELERSVRSALSDAYPKAAVIMEFKTQHGEEFGV